MNIWRAFPLLLVALAFLFLVPPARASDVFSLAKQDLAERLHVNPEQINLYEHFGIIWPDTSLGCPEEGYLYIPILTSGYKMVFEVREKPYIYHTDSTSNVVFCSKKIIPEWYLYYKILFKDSR